MLVIELSMDIRLQRRHVRRLADGEVFTPNDVTRVMQSAAPASAALLAAYEMDVFEWLQTAMTGTGATGTGATGTGATGTGAIFQANVMRWSIAADDDDGDGASEERIQMHDIRAMLADIHTLARGETRRIRNLLELMQDQFDVRFNKQVPLAGMGSSADMDAARHALTLAVGALYDTLRVVAEECEECEECEEGGASSCAVHEYAHADAILTSNNARLCCVVGTDRGSEAFVLGTVANTTFVLLRAFVLEKSGAAVRDVRKGFQ